MTLSFTDIFRGRSRRVAKDLEPHTRSRQTSASSRDRANLPPTENSTRPPSSCSIVPPVFETGKIGLFITHPADHSGSIEAQADADIVAVHGLGGSINRTWGETRSSLERLLPSSLPSSRLLSYGYDSALAFSKPSSGLDNCASDLLLRLRAIRKRTQAGKRPLIFITHDLGGVIVKKALILAEDDPQKYWNITKYVKGIVFIGTPHRDSVEEPLANILQHLVSQARLRQGMRDSIVRNLNQNIELISDTSRRFLPLTPCLSIVSFYQEHAEASVMVPKFAATLGIIDEKTHSRHSERHDEMCHFSSSQSPEYLHLTDSVKHIIIEEEASHDSGLLGLDLLPTRHNSLRRRGSRLMNRLSKKFSESTLKISAENPGRFLHFYRDGESSRPPSAAVSTRSAANPEITVRFNGLRRLSMDTESDETFTEVLQLPKTTLIKDLGGILRGRIPDIDLTGGCRDIKRYKHIDPAQVDSEWARFEAFGHEVKVTWLDVFTTPVMVTEGSSCYDKSRGLKINHRQTISSYLSQLYPSPVEARIDAVHADGTRQPFTLGTPSSAVVAGQNGTPDLRISLRRKIGNGERERLTDLPFGLQRFPIVDVKPFRDRLPASVVAQGGVFVPVNSEIETVKLGFQCNASKRFLIRFLAKGEGAVAGELAVSDQGLDVVSWNKNIAHDRSTLIPDPDWFGTEQAVPEITYSSFNDERDSGFSSQDSEEDSISQDKVEQQKPNQVHLQIIPKLDVGYHYACTTRNIAKQELSGNGKFVPERSQKIFTTYLPDVPSGTRQLDVLKTPEEQGLYFGDSIHVKDFRKKLPPRFKTIRDLFAECPIRGQPKDSIDLSLSSMEWSYRIFAKTVTGQAIPLDVFGQTTVYQLKVWLHEKEGTAIEDQRLIFAGILLQDDACVCDYDIPKGAHIRLVQREVLEPVTAIFMYQGKMYTTDDRCFLIISLKQYIQEQFGIPIEEQRIANGYKELKDGDTISSENVYQVSTTSDGGERPPKSTDLEAAHEHGSQINPNDMRSWDIANSKIVTLSLLDPDTFTETTGLELPEIPGTKPKAAPSGSGYYTSSAGFPPSSGYEKWLQWRDWGEPDPWAETSDDETEPDDETSSEEDGDIDTPPTKPEPLLGPPLMLTDIDDSTPPLNYESPITAL
ncbi:unnamed protein product [Clonostachys rhizophaga]|uniref:Ubiquitin-like domain-containing protein n=1 Tax=Clonostachys rhizophaga TaxID=160324 RepID=A0A9N9YM16_9HYPO|nr:unnamed protein product [Clonostachys rhizophaga]